MNWQASGACFDLGMARIHEPRRHVAQPWTFEEYGRPELIATGYMLLAEWIHQARIALGYSQAGLARAAGVSQSTISRLENGKLEGIRLPRLVVIFVLLADGLRLVFGRPAR